MFVQWQKKLRLFSFHRKPSFLAGPLLLLAISFMTGCGVLEQDHLLPVREREKMRLESDLILEAEVGVGRNLRAPDAVEMAPDLAFAATFNVKRILKGKWDAPDIVILVHSPSRAFGAIPSTENAHLKTYTFYFRQDSRSEKYFFLASEWNLKKQSGPSIVPSRQNSH